MREVEESKTYMELTCKVFKGLEVIQELQVTVAKDRGCSAYSDDPLEESLSFFEQDDKHLTLEVLEALQGKVEEAHKVIMKSL